MNLYRPKFQITRALRLTLFRPNASPFAKPKIDRRNFGQGKAKEAKMFRFLSAGESHGKGLLAIIEGLPAGLKIDVSAINKDLAARQGGFGRGDRMKIEKDRIEFLSGLRDGITLGSPIGLWIPNKDWQDWQEVMDPISCEAKKCAEREILCPRPGHADSSGGLKYDHQDLRNVLERSSARETAIKVAIGAIAKILFAEFGVKIISFVTQIGRVRSEADYLASEFQEEALENSSLRCIDKEIEPKMIEEIKKAKEKGDTIGGVFMVAATGLPPGLGSYCQADRRLDGRLAQALMSIPAIKGVEIGLGFGAAKKSGSRVHDEIFYSKENGFYRKTNNAGGLEGGVTNGMPLVIQAAMKPIPTLKKPLSSVNIKTKEAALASFERSDTCAVPAASVVGQAVVAIELVRAFLEKFGGDSLREIKRNFNGYLEQIKDY